MKVKMKKRSHRYGISKPRSRHGHKYSKYKNCLTMMIFICSKQHLRLSWKKALLIKKACILLNVINKYNETSQLSTHQLLVYSAGEVCPLLLLSVIKLKQAVMRNVFLNGYLAQSRRMLRNGLLFYKIPF